MKKNSIRFVAVANTLLWIAALMLIARDPYAFKSAPHAFTVAPVCMIALIGAVVFFTRHSDWAPAWDVILLVGTLFVIPFYLLIFAGTS